MAIKVYTLLDHLRPTAPISVQVSKDQRVRLDVLPLWKPYKIITFSDENGINTTIRLKLNSNTPYQAEQIEKEKIPANVPFTTAERAAGSFINGVCTTGNLVVQKYLEAYPAFSGFKGFCSDVTGPAYQLFDPEAIILSKNRDFLRQLEAATKISKLNIEDAQSLLIRIFGVSYVPPTTIELAQNVLADFMADAGEEGLSEILRQDVTIDDEATILLGRLVSSGLVSFSAVPGQVVKKGKDNKWINLRAIGNDFDEIERQRYFIEFINAPEGSLLLQDLKNELIVATKKQQVKKKELVTP